jgi:hypothetical protein
MKLIIKGIETRRNEQNTRIICRDREQGRYMSCLVGGIIETRQDLIDRVCHVWDCSADEIEIPNHIAWSLK